MYSRTLKNVFLLVTGFIVLTVTSCAFIQDDRQLLTLTLPASESRSLSESIIAVRIFDENESVFDQYSVNPGGEGQWYSYKFIDSSYTSLPDGLTNPFFPAGTYQNFDESPDPETSSVTLVLEGILPGRNNRNVVHALKAGNRSYTNESYATSYLSSYGQIPSDADYSSSYSTYGLDIVYSVFVSSAFDVVVGEVTTVNIPSEFSMNVNYSYS